MGPDKISEFKVSCICNNVNLSYYKATEKIVWQELYQYKGEYRKGQDKERRKEENFLIFTCFSKLLKELLKFIFFSIEDKVYLELQ